MATRPKAPTKNRSRSDRSPSSRGGWSYFRRANLLTSLVLVLPLLIAYQLSELASGGAVGNGADLLTGPLRQLLHNRDINFLLFNAALLVLFAALVLWLRKREHFDVRLFLPVTIESGTYALCMGTVIVRIMQVIGINPKLAIDGIASALPAAAMDTVPPGVLTRIALSLGAGVHEELVFRLGLLTALAWLFEKGMGLRRFFSIAAAFILSSLVFSAAHHVIGGEPWHLGPFVFRFFCGLIFASLYTWRGFAVAVYTHALYDIWVMLVVQG